MFIYITYCLVVHVQPRRVYQRKPTNVFLNIFHLNGNIMIQYFFLIQGDVV